jgi:uncharacterized protein (DUF488 family)
VTTSRFAARSGSGQHPSVAPRIYSVGYEGLDLAALVDHLKAARVKKVVDVRLNPISRMKGLSRKSLSAALEGAGIAYVHEKELGNPPENRNSFRSGDGGEGRRFMRERLGNGSGPALHRLVEDAREQRIAVLCVEREQNRCHRQVITEMAQELDPTIEVLQIL